MISGLTEESIWGNTGCMTEGVVQLPGAGKVTLLCVGNSVIICVTGRDLNVKSCYVV